MTRKKAVNSLGASTCTKSTEPKFDANIVSETMDEFERLMKKSDEQFAELDTKLKPYGLVTERVCGGFNLKQIPVDKELHFLSENSSVEIRWKAFCLREGFPHHLIARDP